MAYHGLGYSASFSASTSGGVKASASGGGGGEVAFWDYMCKDSGGVKAYQYVGPTNFSISCNNGKACKACDPGESCPSVVFGHSVKCSQGGGGSAPPPPPPPPPPTTTSLLSGGALAFMFPQAQPKLASTTLFSSPQPVIQSTAPTTKLAPWTFTSSSSDVAPTAPEEGMSLGAKVAIAAAVLAVAGGAYYYLKRR